jgi:hypothetical protein
MKISLLSLLIKGLSIENKFMWKELLGNDPLTKDQLAAINESNSFFSKSFYLRSLSALKLVGMLLDTHSLKMVF